MSAARNGEQHGAARSRAEAGHRTAQKAQARRRRRAKRSLYKHALRSVATELSRTKRHVAHRASPRHCHARARCSAPCTRARACRARSTRTHHACAPRQLCTCSHAATRAHVKKLGCRARVTGHWLTVGRLAACTSGANALCNALATSAARAAHASLTRCACHAPPPLSRVQRDEDNERDEDERHDEEDQGHDGRRERVRAARARGSHAPRHMRKHAADRVASTSAKQEPSPRPDGLSKTNARHVATVGGLSP